MVTFPLNLSEWGSVKIGIGDVGGLWKTRIASSMTLPVSRVKGTLPFSSEWSHFLQRSNLTCFNSGHAGKHAAEWCGQNFHEYLLDGLLTEPDTPIPDLMNKTFHLVDKRLSHLAHAGGTSSGCTAVTAFLRIEEMDDSSHKGFTNPGLQARGLAEGKGEDELESQTSLQPSSRRSSMGGGTGGQMGGASTPGVNGRTGSLARRLSSKKIREFVKGLTSGSDKNDDDVIAEDEGVVSAADGTKVEAIEPESEKGIRRVLYTANVGDARAVLW